MAEPHSLCAASAVRKGGTAVTVGKQGEGSLFKQADIKQLLISNKQKENKKKIMLGIHLLFSSGVEIVATGLACLEKPIGKKGRDKCYTGNDEELSCLM